jgi:hypothetical protein
MHAHYANTYLNISILVHTHHMKLPRRFCAGLRELNDTVTRPGQKYVALFEREHFSTAERPSVSRRQRSIQWLQNSNDLARKAVDCTVLGGRRTGMPLTLKCWATWLARWNRRHFGGVLHAIMRWDSARAPVWHLYFPRRRFHGLFAHPPTSPTPGQGSTSSAPRGRMHGIAGSTELR